MTPRTRRDRRALRTAYLLIAMLPVAAWFSGKAHADPISDTYAAKYAGVVCSVLDEYPTYSGIQGVVIGIHNDGLTWYESGEVLGTAVFNVCPRHADLVKSWAHATTSGISPVYSA